MFKDFVKNQEAADREVFIQSVDLYVDCLNKSDYEKVLTDLDDEIKALKRELEEATKIELDSIKKFQDFMSSPNLHFK